MNINDLAVDELGLICVINVQLDESQKALYKLMQMGIVEGLEIRKVGEVVTCAEYQVEGISGRIVISKELGDYINICKLDDTN